MCKCRSKSLSSIHTSTSNGRNLDIAIAMHILDHVNIPFHIISRKHMCHGPVDFHHQDGLLVHYGAWDKVMIFPQQANTGTELELEWNGLISNRCGRGQVFFLSRIMDCWAWNFDLFVSVSFLCVSCEKTS